MSVVTLYRKNTLGISEWSIWADSNTIKIAHSTVLGGAKVMHEEVVHCGKQSRSLQEQVQHRIASRISKQRDKGYVEDIETAATQLLNQLGLDVPMLAQTYKDERFVTAHVQRKLNGLRCLATKQDGQIVMYSRKGKQFDNLHEIAEGLMHLLNEGDTFDGELYCHGQPLQTIQSWIKRRQDNTLKIKYVVYDYMDSEVFMDRYEYLISRFHYAATKGLNRNHIMLLPTKRVSNVIEVLEAMSKARSAGFEGLMVRLHGFGYENGKRSKSLLKVKEVFDDEAICTDLELSDKSNPVLVLQWKGKTFRASPPGSHADRINAYENRHSRIGQRVTFEYRELTKDGIPFHAVATCWRED